MEINLPKHLPQKAPQDALEFHRFEERQALTLLRRNEYLVVFVIIFTVVISQLWFIAVVRIYQQLLGTDQPEWWQNLILAIIGTLIYILIIIHILNIPITLLL